MTEIMLGNANPSWPIFRLGQLFRERREKVSDRDFPPLSVTKRGIVPQLETAAKSDDGDNRKGVRAGDFVINSRSDRKGSGGLSELDGSVSLINIVLEPLGIHPRFAHHLLRSAAFQEEFYRWGHGIVADLWTTRYSDMKSIRLAVPDLETQRTIANFLDRETDRIDQLIEKKLQMVTLTNKKFDNQVHMLIAQGEAQAPSQPLHRFCKIVTGKTPSREEEANFSNDSGLPWATPANLGEFDPIVSTKEKLTAAGLVGQVVVPSGTVLINGIGASIGKIGIAGCEMSFNQQIHGIIQRRPVLRGRFLFYVMRTRKEEIVSLASNTTIPIINADRFGKIRIPLPSYHFQEVAILELDEALSRAKTLSEAVLRSVVRLGDFRSSLITSAVTGQMDVDTWRKRERGPRQLDQLIELRHKEARA